MGILITKSAKPEAGIIHDGPLQLRQVPEDNGGSGDNGGPSNPPPASSGLSSGQLIFVIVRTYCLIYPFMLVLPIQTVTNNPPR
jgi:hypothetical protein